MELGGGRARPLGFILSLAFSTVGSLENKQTKTWHMFCLLIFKMYLFLPVLGLHCRVQASHYSGFSCCGVWAQ